MIIMAGKINIGKEGKAATPKGGASIYPWDVILYPHLTEKSMNMVEMENKLVLIVNRKYKKEEIKQAIENEFNVKVSKIRTVVTSKGKKKVIATLTQDFQASDMASKLGMM